MRLACVQADATYGDPQRNLARALDELELASRAGADLIVFPEAFLTGYCANTEDEAQRIALSVGCSELTQLRRRCEELNVLCAVGFAETDEGTLYNSLALFEPGRPMRVYRKNHLPYLGYDRFAHPGHDLPVFETRIGRIGILVCFDLRIPEAARVLALKGAELILVPTNWPEGAEVSADYISVSRAAENRVFLAAVNRVGQENGFRFIGRSKVVSPTGRVLYEAHAEEKSFIVDLDLEEARTKRTVTIPGVYETDCFATRQPDLYKSITEILQPVEPK